MIELYSFNFESGLSSHSPSECRASSPLPSALLSLPSLKDGDSLQLRASPLSHLL